MISIESLPEIQVIDDAGKKFSALFAGISSPELKL
jgi:hypothetical protein